MVRRSAFPIRLLASLLVAFALAGGALGQGEPLAGMDTAAGETVFTANCAACHQATGAGIPAAFPPLAAHVPAILGVEGGRAYLMDVLLFGLQGPITVDGADYNGLMPAWGHLTDQQIADVLDHVAAAWGNAELLPADFPAFTADEVMARRADALTSAQVHEKRGTLALDGR